MARATTVHDDDVFALTAKGLAELRAADTHLTAAELQVLVLLDGVLPVVTIAEFIPGATRGDVDAAILGLVGAKHIVNTVEPDSNASMSGFSTIAVPAGFFGSLKGEVSPEAKAGAAILKQHGYYVRIARRRAGAGETRSRDGWKPTIVVIDDDLDLQKLIRTYFTLEGFNVRAAMKRDDVSIVFRLPPTPDLVLLDVNLPDANGFDVLARMRQHPVLKNMPVIMLTAETTREAVLRGLNLGCDGYVTKPFEADVLVGAVKAVLGLSPVPEEKKKP